VPFVAYVHAQDPNRPEDPGRPPWEPNGRVLRWVGAAIVVSFAVTLASGVLQTALIFLAFALGCRAAAEALPNGDGLREWRQ
jgi:hypothetical protein